MGFQDFGENVLEFILMQRSVIEPKFWAGAKLKSKYVADCQEGTMVTPPTFLLSEEWTECMLA